jgi:hypothetical protein
VRVAGTSRKAATITVLALAQVALVLAVVVAVWP